MTAPAASATTPAQFVAKWRSVGFGEKQAAQEMFLDLCALVGHPTPVAYGNPDAFTFEKWVPGGFADAYLEERFGWEFKGSDADLDDAFNQLLRYQVYLKTPPLLIVSSFQTIRIRTNFPGMETVLHEIPVARLDEPAHLELLRQAFFDPDALRPGRSVAQVTEETAALFHDIVADMERHFDTERDADPERVAGDPERLARHLNRIVFCLYAADAGLLPDGLFARILRQHARRPDLANQAIANLFAQMASGGLFGADAIAHFNGDLFQDADRMELSAAALQRLGEAAGRNWRNIEPSIFGALFERALDAAKRAYLGAHYTSADDIMLVVDPVVMQPLRREWDAARREIDSLLDDDKSDDNRDAAFARLEQFRERLAGVTVLDPACGSGNFLYLALRSLLDLEKEAIDYAATQGWHGLAPRVQPSQMLGIELEHYAAELARTALWIGYIQWHRSNGFPYTRQPILTPLDTIRRRDAILQWSDAGRPAEPEWPAAEFIIGNPPFLGHRPFRESLGDAYVDSVYSLYGNRIPNSSDLCCYWLEKARAQIEAGQTRRAGLLATQAIRFQSNRPVLQRIKERGDIFEAVSDRNWILDGANVHISIICFDDGSQTERTLDGNPVANINTDLTAGADLTQARRLAENRNLSFMGIGKVGDFDIPETLAVEMMAQPNPHGRSNTDVLKRWINGVDITRRPRNVWVIDFGVAMTESEAAMYEAPFEYVKAKVRPERIKNKMAWRAQNWWLHGYPATTMRHTLAPLSRYIGTPKVATHRFFVWLSADMLPSNLVIAIASDDDYIFGVLSSSAHELWARRVGSQLRESGSGGTYTPTTCFETFPFPRPTESQRAAVARAAAQLHRLRENWLNPAPPSGGGDGGVSGGASSGSVSGGASVSVSRSRDGSAGPSRSGSGNRTLTGLYNRRPTWLDNAHNALDAAVSDAYGWPPDLPDGEILERLLALNLRRAAGG